MLKIVCFKWKHVGGYRLPSSIGNEYTAEHVNRLQWMVQQHLTIPHEFVCVTDDPAGINCKTIPLWDKCRDLGGCYNRLYVFSEDMRKLIGERFACIDLDCTIVDSLDPLFSRQDDFIINQYLAYRRGREQYYNGALFIMNAGARKQVWDEWEKDGYNRLEAVRKDLMLVGTDQAWISYVLGRGESMFTEDCGVYSYKRISNTRELPRNARVVMFSGDCDPSTSKELPWILTHYYGEEGMKTTRDVLPKLQHTYSDLISESKRGEKRMGYCPDILNPKSFSEKILWRKFFARDPAMVTTADKFAVREYIKHFNLGIEAVPLLAAENDPTLIDWKHLPVPFIIKPTHRSGSYRIVKTRDELNVDVILRDCSRWLAEGYGASKFEWMYAQIPPRIIVEPFLTSPSGEQAVDYKLFMLNGKCVVVQVNRNRMARHTQLFYDGGWNLLDVTRDGVPKGEVEKRPKQFTLMKKAAQKLAARFDFVRVDFLGVGEDVYFGEMTYFPNSGVPRFKPQSFDFDLGQKLRLTV